MDRFTLIAHEGQGGWLAVFLGTGTDAANLAMMVS
jgi:hypothetical protein